jgi:hypothetical protein
VLTGDVPSPANPPQACRFHTRCPKAQEICSTEEPILEPKGTGSTSACHFPLTREEADRLLGRAEMAELPDVEPPLPEEEAALDGGQRDKSHDEPELD